MRLDHVSYAAAPDGLAPTTARLGALLGKTFSDGGLHPRFGTRNTVLALQGGCYVEVVAALDHPASDKAPFGQAVKARSQAGGGWLAWVVSVDDLHPYERRFGRTAVSGHRRRPDGYDLRWHQIGVTDAQADPQLPFVMRWDVPPDEHPSAGAGTTAVRLTGVEIVGDCRKVSAWLGEPLAAELGGVAIRWSPPSGRTGVLAAHFSTPTGQVRI